MNDKVEATFIFQTWAEEPDNRIFCKQNGYPRFARRTAYRKQYAHNHGTNENG